jgi:hypothetical protein
MKTRCPLRNAESVRQIPWDDDGGWHLTKLKAECEDLIAAFKPNPNFAAPVTGLEFGLDVLAESLCELQTRLHTIQRYILFLHSKREELDTALGCVIQEANARGSSDTPPIIHMPGDTQMIIEEGTGTRLEDLANALLELEDGSLVSRIEDMLDTLVLISRRHSALRVTDDYPTGGMKRAAVESKGGARKEGWEFLREEYVRNQNRTTREVYDATVALFAKTHPMIKFPLLWDTVRAHFKKEVKLKAIA